MAIENRQSVPRRVAALLEVVLLLAATLTAVGLVANSSWAVRQQVVLEKPFLEYLVLMAVPVGVLLLTGRGLKPYGISAHRLKDNAHGALLCMVPYAGAHGLLLLASPPPVLSAALGTLLALGVLFLSTRLLPPRASGEGVVICLALPLVLLGGQGPASAASALTFHVLFLGPGEEILFRGYLQSRLNQAFGRPWTYRGVQMGWGLPLTAALFGIFHLLNLPELYAGHLGLDWGTGVSTAAWGLFFGYLREWSGSVVAPAMVHGIPQGMAMAMMEW